MKREISAVKNFILLIVAIALIVVTVVIFVIPNIHKYRDISTKYRQEMLALENIQKYEIQMNKTVRELEQKSRIVLDSFNQSFSKSKFIRDSRKFFMNTNLQQVDRSVEDKFTIYQFNASSSIRTPSNFYNFLDYLSTYKNIIQVDFPINFKSKGDVISASFKLKVYNLSK